MTFQHHPFKLLSPEELDLVTHDHIAIRGLIGVGTTGVVYKAQQTRLGRTVALKVLSKIQRQPFCEFRERFMLEAKALARLSHPNIVRIHDIGETRTGFPYVVMEYVDGFDLATLIGGGQLTLEHVGSWVPQTCEAVEHAHNHELVHRGLKPANIMIDRDGRVKITDFGLVKGMSQPDFDHLAHSQVAGASRTYFAPEILEAGAAVDHRADVYSMGVILFELLTGALPGTRWVPPSELRPGLDPRFDAVVARAMQRQPSARHPRIADLGREVLALAVHPPAGDPPALTVAAGKRPGTDLPQRPWRAGLPGWPPTGR